ncbi:carbohydrate ABC transporter permease [Labrys monachus]|uniref:Multiple sugar transport system permease protein n=1 Tax=Labrys monachus TaxID=217067 RepID=A0ABU0FG58_9HYPH|nr:carbohydrate ABC transporter permease [Labrys monachus]MDQ0393594.1 multiple sugar transport system permease protein [Labrys monachus]
MSLFGHAGRRRRIGPWSGLAAVAMVAFFALPIAYLVSVSFKTPDQVLTGHFLPDAPTLYNWGETFRVIPLVRFLVNSLAVACFSAALTLAIALPATYAMIRLKVGGRFLPAFILATYVAPPVVALIPLFMLLRWLGLLNTVAGLVLVNAVANLPVAFWLLSGFLRRLPPEIDEAAWMDGAGHATVICRIIAPMLTPGLVATGLICGILAYDEFLLASAFSNDEGSRTLPVAIALFQGERLINFGQMAVASLTGIVPVYLIGLFAQRFLIGGLTAGSIKG